LAGKRVGDSFLLTQGSVVSTRATIAQIASKTVLVRERDLLRAIYDEDPAEAKGRVQVTGQSLADLEAAIALYAERLEAAPPSTTRWRMAHRRENHDPDRAPRNPEPMEIPVWRVMWPELIAE
jgi:hypothetical protein